MRKAIIIGIASLSLLASSSASARTTLAPSLQNTGTAILSANLNRPLLHMIWPGPARQHRHPAPLHIIWPGPAHGTGAIARAHDIDRANAALANDRAQAAQSGQSGQSGHRTAHLADGSRSTTPAPLPTYWITQGDWWYDNTTDQPGNGKTSNVTIYFAPQPDYDYSDLSTCDYAPSPLSLEVKDGKRWVRISVPDQCDWSGAPYKSSANIQLGPATDGGIRIDPMAKSGNYPIRIYSGYRVYSGTPLATGVMQYKMKSVDYPEVRIYQWVNGQYNDSFFNTCIKQGKTLTSADHGNFYCVAKDGMTHYTEKIRIR